jgi:hypothetical protein
MSFQNRFGNDSRKLFSGNLEESSWTIYNTPVEESRANISKRI